MLAKPSQAEQQLVGLGQRDDTGQRSEQVPRSGRSSQRCFEHHPVVYRSPELELVLGRRETDRPVPKNSSERGTGRTSKVSVWAVGCQCSPADFSTWPQCISVQEELGFRTQFRKEGHVL